MAEGVFLSSEEYAKIYNGYAALANERDEARHIASLLYNICLREDTPLLDALEWPAWLEPKDD